MRDLKDGIRALVRLDFQGRVHKTFRGTDNDKRFEQECLVLKALEERGCDYVPRLLEAHPEELRIVTTSCGAPAPALSEKKAQSLFAALERDFGILHDDPFPRNVTYSPQLGRFCLIDFELATILPMPGTCPVPESDIWKVRWHARTEKGSTHSANDDAWLALSLSENGSTVRSDLSESLLDPNHLLLGVSDGMGGQNAGELASRLIFAWVKKKASLIYSGLRTSPDDLSPILSILKEAHQGLNQLAEENGQSKRMGATATIAYITPGKLHYAHIGDSRLYLHRAGETQLITSDQTIAFREWADGKISEYQFRSHPRRSALYDCLGAGHQMIHPQLGSLDLLHGDRILLCTDGIVDGLAETAIHHELKSESPLETIAADLHKRSLDNDGKDDSTFIFAEISRV